MKNDKLNSIFYGEEQHRSVGQSAGFPEANEVSFGGSKSVSPPKDDGGSTGRGTRLSFKDEIKAVAERLELYAVREIDKALAYELCAIIAEVNIMRPCFSVKIGGEALEAGLVKEIFSCLTNEHIENVIAAFDSCKYEIRNKKAYLRTALYNSVFELEAGQRNLFNYVEG